MFISFFNLNVFKKQLFKTGGGSAGGSKLTCTQEILLAELVHVEPLQNEFDSAASYFCNISD
jgi:hypothetical protein